MIQHNTEMSIHSSSARQDLEKYLRMFSNIEKMKNENPELFILNEDTNVTARQVFGRYIPEAYINWDIVNENCIRTIKNPDKMIDIVFTELCVNVGRSKPNGRVNECLTKSVRGL